MDSGIPLWASGPGELLQHGIDLLSKDSESQRRIALILIDNSVELIAQTYISLPKRVTGLQLTRKQREEYCSTFPTLLDGLEEHASEKMVGLNLGEFEWFHRLRNQLYHEGNGLTVERRFVEVYAELAIKLFESLFGCSLNLTPPEGSRTEMIGEFFEDWIDIERKLTALAGAGKPKTTTAIVAQFYKDGRIDEKKRQSFHEVQVIRNELIHGEAEPEELLRPENSRRVKAVKNWVSKMFDDAIKEATESFL